jgi:hypothetical protein
MTSDCSTGDPTLTNLDQLLHRLCDGAGDGDKVSIGALVEAVGNRSFGPLILVAGLIALSPLSGIPGIPTTVAVIVGLVAGQMLFGRKHFWLPQWVLRRSVSRKRFEKALRWVRRPARAIDRLLRPRLTFLTDTIGAYAIAVLCVLIASAMPPMELVPFAATIAGAALTAFGLALIARDGVVALLALILTAGITGLTIGTFI